MGTPPIFFPKAETFLCEIYSVTSILMDSFIVPAPYQYDVVGDQFKSLMGWVVEQKNPLKDSATEGFASIPSFLNVRQTKLK